MGLFDKLGGFLTGEGRSAYGVVDLPGEITLDLPAGTLTVHYCEWGQVDELTHWGPPAGYRVSATPAGGEPVVLDDPSRIKGQQPTQEGPYLFVEIGQVELTAPGRWTVAGTVPEGASPGAHLRLGP